MTSTIFGVGKRTNLKSNRSAIASRTRACVVASFLSSRRSLRSMKPASIISSSTEESVATLACALEKIQCHAYGCSRRANTRCSSFMCKRHCSTNYESETSCKLKAHGGHRDRFQRDEELPRPRTWVSGLIMPVAKAHQTPLYVGFRRNWQSYASSKTVLH